MRLELDPLIVIDWDSHLDGLDFYKLDAQEIQVGFPTRLSMPKLGKQMRKILEDAEINNNNNNNNILKLTMNMAILCYMTC